MKGASEFANSIKQTSCMIFFYITCQLLLNPIHNSNSPTCPHWYPSPFLSYRSNASWEIFTQTVVSCNAPGA